MNKFKKSLFPIALCTCAAALQAHPLANTRLVMEGASCAGFEFIGEDWMKRYDELTCSRNGEPTVSARVRSLSENTLLAVEEAGPDGPQGCPPQTWVFRIEALGEGFVTLNEVWTGWNTFPDESVRYRVQSNSQGRAGAGTGAGPVYRIEAMEAGDIACYITFVDEQQIRQEGMADFSLCERPLVGQQVRFSYQQTRVAAASCQGDPECTDYDSVPLIVDAQPVR